MPEVEIVITAQAPELDLSWIGDHRERWAALVRQGWLFEQPADRHRGKIGVVMRRADSSDGCTVTVKGIAPHRGPREIHTELLTQCEQYAAGVTEAPDDGRPDQTAGSTG